jgi:RimJ/RimL family protein N-acetyltransferase/nitroimidazol reductase NimA-like FMN-containing flavoprotein (pyridoxamine 5'-phosphate oxidase superfamily)
MTFPATQRTTPHRKRERVGYERATAHALLDEALHCHLGFVVDGEPRVLPMLEVRVGDTLYLHGSTGAAAMLDARAEGLPVCVTVTHLDALVLARSWTNHSVNYRSVVVHGRAHLVTEPDEKWMSLSALVDKVGPGRAAQTRPSNPAELARTAVLALTLREVSVKARVGGVVDEEEDLALPYWAGVVPLRVNPGLPEPAAGVTAATPEYLRPQRGPWLEAPRLRGDHVELSALDLSYVDELFKAVADPRVYQHIPSPMPTSADEMAGYIVASLRDWQRGVRVPLVQRCPRTGQVIGTTSLYGLDETNRGLAIGYTMLAPERWRTGVNTESKLMLLGHAFDTLGAVRVEWHTDIRNERSQAAIERLGAVRDGLLRKHKQRADGSWRDTVLYSMTDDQWPAAQERLQNLLSQHAVDR